MFFFFFFVVVYNQKRGFWSFLVETRLKLLQCGYFALSGRAWQRSGIRVATVLFRILGSIVVSIRVCHMRDPGSIPGRGEFLLFCVSKL